MHGLPGGAWFLFAATSLASIPGSQFAMQGLVDSAAGPRITNARNVTITSF